MTSIIRITQDTKLLFFGRDSGIGDFGEEGIDTFLCDHRCNNVCKALQLHYTVPLSTEKPKDKGKRVRRSATSSAHHPPKKQRSSNVLETEFSDFGERIQDKEVEVVENMVKESEI